MFLRSLRLGIVFALLAPSLIHAATLGIPGSGTTLSGIGVISGWKCQANGELTVRFDGGDAIPLLYGSERPDVLEAGACASAEVGFVAIWNWGNLEAGEHTAVAYDNGVEFARSTFTVVRASEEKSFLEDVVAECTVPDFPDAGTNARFEWSQGTQHLELAEVGEDVVVPVSTAFDGVWELTFEVLWPIHNNIEPQCNCLTVGTTLRGLLEVRKGQAESVKMACIGGDDDIWFALIRHTGHLEGSWGAFSGDDLITLGSWDGNLANEYGAWFHRCGTAGTWEAVRIGDS